MNDHNKSFYEKIDIQSLKGFAEKVGMHTGADIDQIFPLIMDKSPLLELGAGYGRVIDFLIERGFPHEIYALERSENLLSYIADHHSKEQVHVLMQDMKHLEIPTPPEAVLWMWSGIMEMSNQESMGIFKAVYRVLKQGGYYIVELPHKEIKVVGNVKSNKLVELDTEWGSLKAYFPEEKEIITMAMDVGFELEKSIEYKTATDLNRIIFVFKK